MKAKVWEAAREPLLEELLRSDMVDTSKPEFFIKVGELAYPERPETFERFDVRGDGKEMTRKLPRRKR